MFLVFMVFSLNVFISFIFVSQIFNILFYVVFSAVWFWGFQA
jgi:hypothetical protein